MYNFMTIDELEINLEYALDYSSAYWFDYDDNVFDGEVYCDE